MASPLVDDKRSTLDRLPAELVECVLLDLSLDDIRNVRLVSHGVYATASSGRFKTFCRAKTVDLRSYALAKLSERIAPGSIACNLQDLTVTGVLYVTTSLEKILRTKTVPADPTDIFGKREDALGNSTAIRPNRVSASSERMVDTQRELDVLRMCQEEAAVERSLGQDFSALVDLFTCLREHGVLHGLRSVTLDVTIERFAERRLAPKDGGAWRPIWETAAHTFQVTMRALAAARLPLQCLDAFAHVGTCSLSGFDMACVLQDNPPDMFDDLLHNIRSLSISTSKRLLHPIGFAALQDADPDDEVHEHRFDNNRRDRLASIVPPTPAGLAELEAMAADSRDTTGLAHLLAKMPKLEELDLQSYYLYYSFLSAPSAPEGDKFTTANIVRTSGLRRLKKLTLRGRTVDVTDLLGLLNANPDLEAVDFGNIWLHGTWQPIFAHLTSANNKFTRLHFDVVFETTATGSAYVQFPGIRSGILSVPAPAGAAAFTLEGRENVLQGITYKRSEQWVMGCVQHSMWRQERRRVYGPPGAW
ncbi:hypothetical protein B0A55_01507 [Friedmanniomyces simplex]|uniref:F-box domain-containing protein n=2 Tax=Friedmanniomyces simplex TaxID=329884 RepID=A0A4U0XW40_9PEZI|nr:hypothetical protein B0A55_01507 [Friedmanniomyces simplex]